MKVGPYYYATAHRGQTITGLTLTGQKGTLQVGQKAGKGTFNKETVVPVRGQGPRYSPRGEVTKIEMGSDKTKTGTFITLDVSFAGRGEPLRISVFDVASLEIA